MEFFSWINVSQLFYDLFYQSFIPNAAEATKEEVARAAILENYISLAVAGGVFLLLLILGGIGLNAMAKKAGKKGSVLAFLPFANTYFSGKLAGETSFFGQKMKRAGLYAMIAEIAYSALEVFRLVLNLLLINPQYIVQVKEEGAESIIWQIDRASIPELLRWQYDALNYSQIVSYILLFVAIICMFTLYVALFRKYYAKNPVLMTLLCTLFCFRGIVLFAVRKNTPVNYQDYLRRRAEQYRQKPSYPENTSEPQNSAQTQESPFSDFKDDSSDPFDFDRKN